MQLFKILFLFIILLIILFPSPEAISAPEVYRVTVENRFLKSEYQLARTSQIYFLFNLPQKRIQVKFRGAVLKEFLIDSFYSWGTPIQPIPYFLIKKKAFLEPKRPRMAPGMNQENFNYEAYIFEVDDMPVRYRLLLGPDFSIYVRPTSNGIFSTLVNRGASVKSFLFNPILSLWRHLNQRPFGGLGIYLSEKESKSLYWSLKEKQVCLVLNGEL